MANYPLRLPESVRKAAELAAELDGVSLNQFFATAIAEKAAMLTAARVLDERAARADRARFDEVMARIGRSPPREGDESRRRRPGPLDRMRADCEAPLMTNRAIRSCWYRATSP